ncbi:MAG: glutamate 5-kinase [Deltaproteobacteria bacterium]|nr:glutamate 5-kinase [Deltaproteobacteria bacterium]
MSSRKKIVDSVKRVVIKIGSGALTTKEGLNLDVINALSKDISHLMEENGLEIVFISSGAIASGIKKMGYSQRPQSISQQQAAAAVGQSTLMLAYEEAFKTYDKKVAQILVTKDDLTNRKRYLNTRNTLFTLLHWKVIPIINENDTVVVDEIKFGDNDNLSAMIANLAAANLVINLTNIDGFFDDDPRVNKNAHRISVVEKVTSKIEKIASSIPGSLGKGGMESKIKAARHVAMCGIPTIIANGTKKNIIRSIFEGQDEGTLFLPQPIPMKSRKHWIAFAKSPKGKIMVDRGAENALIRKGKSLLPSGVIAVYGRFIMGNSVIVMNQQKRSFAVGLVNYQSADVEKIMGLKTSEIEEILGYKHYDEIIHKDNLVLIDNHWEA